MPRLDPSPVRQGDPLSEHRLRSLWLRTKNLPHDVLHRYHRLGRKGKASIWIVTAINVLILAAIIIITPTRIGLWFNSLALSVKDMGWKGVVLCNVFAILSSHPPLFGFMPTLTLIGFVYGIWPGFLIAGIASMLGAGIAFLSVRSFFLGVFKKNDKWEAFGHVMRTKGLPLVIMIRYCPVPWGVSNGLFASIESVKFWHFMVANLMIQPKLLLYVFIGSRLTSLASDSAAHDPLRFWLNLISIVVSVCVSIATGVIIYRLTLQQMRKLDQSGAGFGDGELAAEALEENTLLGDYDVGSDDDEAELLTASNDRDREGSGKRLKVGGGGGIIRRNSSQDTTDSTDVV
ncbi:hypothetical protein I308_103835 [Cryptococcus tetragattii IND107]|uniref:Golgi apparatus membrane protein TVP38 n=1 Tax=Cryptococcus tetragattii IND107 TaxID=1296105 RepID=A0ABR3BRE4_9TREE|nr:hypothetical protein I308_03313 [Cryptococcus tetragattii IND107]